MAVWADESISCGGLNIIRNPVGMGPEPVKLALIAIWLSIKQKLTGITLEARRLSMRLTDSRLLIVPLLLIAACQSETAIAPAPTQSPQGNEGQIDISSLSGMPAEEFFDIPWEDLSPFEDGLIRSERSRLTQWNGTTLYRMDITIEEELTQLSGREMVYYTNTEEVALEEIYFRLYPNLFQGAATISNLTLDGAAIDASLELADSALRLALSEPLQPGESVEVGMTFSIDVPTELSGNYGLFAFFNDTLVLHKFYPVIPVFDDEGWNVEIPPTHADVSYFDASFYLVRLTAAEELLIAASGIEVDRDVRDRSQILTIAAGPARGFYIAASDKFTLKTKKAGETMIRSYAYGGLEEASVAGLNIASNALTDLGARLGPFPYTEFDIVSTPMEALGMEYPGITAVAFTLYEPEAIVAGLPSQILLESVIVHEIAHQWFYNIVGNDQVDEPWLDEAVTQFATGLYYRDEYGEGGDQGFINSWISRWERVGRADIPIGLRTSEYTPQEYSAIIYGRGPLFIKELEEAMGPETFAEFLEAYVQHYKWEEATGEGFKALAESHCSCDLDPLFEAWVYGRD
jgi:hypothetical protein